MSDPVEKELERLELGDLFVSLPLNMAEANDSDNEEPSLDEAACRANSVLDAMASELKSVKLEKYFASLPSFLAESCDRSASETRKEGEASGVADRVDTGDHLTGEGKTGLRDGGPDTDRDNVDDIETEPEQEGEMASTADLSDSENEYPSVVAADPMLIALNERLQALARLIDFESLPYHMEELRDSDNDGTGIATGERTDSGDLSDEEVRDFLGDDVTGAVKTGWWDYVTVADGDNMELAGHGVQHYPLNRFGNAEQEGEIGCTAELSDSDNENQYDGATVTDSCSGETVHNVNRNDLADEAGASSSYAHKIGQPTETDRTAAACTGQEAVIEPAWQNPDAIGIIAHTSRLLPPLPPLGEVVEFYLDSDDSDEECGG